MWHWRVTMPVTTPCNPVTPQPPLSRCLQQQQQQQQQQVAASSLGSCQLLLPLVE
jgi:hypothetical protein